MAYAATHQSADRAEHSGIYNFFAAIGTALMNMAESNSKMKEIQRLQSMSDEALAKKGLAREDIVRYVFSDYYYI